MPVSTASSATSGVFFARLANGMNSSWRIATLFQPLLGLFCCRHCVIRGVKRLSLANSAAGWLPSFIFSSTAFTTFVQYPVDS